MRAPALTFKRARALRRKMTLPEVLLWQQLRGTRCGGLRFRRQYPIGPYILDFYCASHQLAVEVDGAVHDGAAQAAHDERRAAWLAQRGIEVLRFKAADILNERGLGNVFAMIAAVAVRGAAPSTAFGGSPPPLCGGGQRGASDRK
ncbi:MAG: endonuclease domain-containing protein [Sphingomonadales bacterium]|nr:endonuclease domain-containing protein [Sphingomonadales bacterium]